jgi:DNA polymerase-3 subunit chi
MADSADSDPADGDLVINLAASVPPGFEAWARVAEVVDAEAARRQRGRERFRAYRERGIEPATHEMRNES